MRSDVIFLSAALLLDLATAGPLPAPHYNRLEIRNANANPTDNSSMHKVNNIINVIEVDPMPPKPRISAPRRNIFDITNPNRVPNAQNVDPIPHQVQNIQAQDISATDPNISTEWESEHQVRERLRKSFPILDRDPSNNNR